MIIVWYGMVTYTVLRDGAIFLIIFPIWSIAEITRYAYYTTKAMGIKHWTLTWMRYTLPIVLYPIGACADFSTTYLFHETIINDPIITRYDVYIMYFGVIMFPIGFPFMYGHLLAQRTKVLGKQKMALEKLASEKLAPEKLLASHQLASDRNQNLISLNKRG